MEETVEETVVEEVEMGVEMGAVKAQANRRQSSCTKKVSDKSNHQNHHLCRYIFHETRLPRKKLRTVPVRLNRPSHRGIG